MDYTKINQEEILDQLKQSLDEKRFKHSIGTAQCAKELALRYNQDAEKAYIAGLLHDCAKCLPDKELLDMMHKYVDIASGELMNPKTWHAPVGAYLAEHQFKISDKEILNAIRWHTVGKIKMSDFEKIIFLADKVEPQTRSKEYLDKVRELLNLPDGLDKAMLVCYKETIKSLVERDLKICPLTIDIYNNLQEQLG